MLTIREVADKLGVHPMTIYRLIKAGKLRGHKVGSVWRIYEVEVNTYLENNRR